MRRSEDARFLTGRGKFIADVAIPGALHAVIVRSMVPHGILRRVVAAAALAHPGVRAVFTASDLPASAQAIPIRMAVLPGLDRFLQPLLAREKVRYAGEPVALVVAETRAAADEAALEVELEIDALPAIADRSAAGRAEALLFEAVGTNIASHYAVGCGDVEAVFGSAPYRRRERFRVQRHTGMPMETRGLVAEWFGAKQQLRVWGAAKVAFPNRKLLASMLAMPEASIELIEVDIGGGFGVRGEFHPEDFLIPFAARVLESPVQWMESRSEHFLAANHSRDVEADLEIACLRDGTILGLRGHVYSDIGAYARTTGGIVAANAARNLPGPYRIANFACAVDAFVTNKTPVGTYRGPGLMEATYFHERRIDMAASDLGVDAAAIRRRNLVGAEEMPSNRGRLVPYPESDTIYDSGDFQDTFDRAVAAIGWNEARGEPGPRDDAWQQGKGICCFVSSSGVGPREAAKIVLRPGGIDLHVGVSTMGQGHETVFSQICGDALGLPSTAIAVWHGSTTELQEGFGTFHSRAVVMASGAILDAAAKFVNELRPIVAHALGSPNAAIEWRDGEFRAEGRAPLSIAEAMALAVEQGRQIKADGRFDQSKRTYTYGTHAARVLVNPETGEIRVLDYVAFEDIGRIINPLLAEGQAIGAIVQGLGGAMLENLVYDQNAQLLAGTFMDYAMPRAADFPQIHSTLLEAAPSPSNPLGVKGAGEGAIIPVACTIANAVAAALADLGVEIHDLPLTPCRLWERIRDRQGPSLSGP